MNKENLSPKIVIRPYLPRDEYFVIDLWKKCGLLRPQNNPSLDIRRKMSVNPELFLIGLFESKVVASAMGGYEGHRGWVNYLAVDPDYQKKGLGRLLMCEIEKRLLVMGCPKLNLQIRNDNLSVISFYEKIGYKMDDVVGMGKRLMKDDL
jgi:ribosomal protein S18 acetylase RimI-like enzyme